MHLCFGKEHRDSVHMGIDMKIDEVSKFPGTNHPDFPDDAPRLDRPLDFPHWQYRSTLTVVPVAEQEGCSMCEGRRKGVLLETIVIEGNESYINSCVKCWGHSLFSSPQKSAQTISV